MAINVRKDQQEWFALQKVKHRMRVQNHAIAWGGTSTSATVVYCPSCKSPVVSSREGRSGHQQRTGCSGMES